ncbi:hypothetical protein, partial [Enterococcus faecium]|uniref:hypothetical protein n=1 Tax=Enterococcus faecium TaxID=1352 RepID=UPI003F43E1E5
EGQTQQVLTYDQIEEMKKAGEANIIQQVVNGNVHFGKKTPYAQAKYIRRKQQKFGKRFRILQINTYNLNRHFYMI